MRITIEIDETGPRDASGPRAPGAGASGSAAGAAGIEPLGRASDAPIDAGAAAALAATGPRDGPLPLASGDALSAGAAPTFGPTPDGGPRVARDAAPSGGPSTAALGAAESAGAFEG